MPDDRLTRAELAKRWQVSKPMLTKYASRGLPFESDGRIAVEAADQWRAGNVVRGRSGNPHVRARREPLDLAENPPKSPVPKHHVEECRPRIEQRPDDGEVSETLAEAVRQEAWVKLREREVKLAIQEGKLVDLFAVNAYVAGAIIKARDELLRIGPELRDQLAQESDPVAVEEILLKRHVRVLAGLAEYRVS